MSVKNITIDKTPDGKLYRYNIEYDNGGSSASCFCHHSLNDVLDAMCWMLELHGEVLDEG